MPTIQATRLRVEGNVIYITAAPAIGILTLNSFTDNATGESGSTEFLRTFRYSKNGVTWSEWQQLTTSAITSISVATTDTLCIEMAYEKQQPLGADSLHVSSVSIGTTQASFTEGECFKNSIFYQFFQSNDPAVLAWYINVLEKLYEKGIIPPFVERLNAEGLPDDFVDFWKSITKFFSFLVNYAREYQNFNENLSLTAEYLEQRGLKTSVDNTLDSLNNLMNTFYEQIAQRGTINIVHDVNKGIYGELLRLIYFVSTDEFLFNLYKPEHFGWNVGNCSPLHRSLYLNDNINKSYEKGFDILKLSNYSTVGAVGIEIDGGHSTMKISGSGGIVVTNKYIKIDPTLDYEISFMIKKSAGKTLTFSCTPFDSSNTPLVCRNLSTGVSTNVFLVSASLVRDDRYIRVRGIIYNSGMALNPGNTLELNQGNNLILPANAVKIIPTITITSGTAQIYGIRILPLTTPYSRGFVQVGNFISAWIKNNNHNFSFRQVEEFIKRYLIPYNAHMKAINIADGYGVESLPTTTTTTTTTAAPTTTSTTTAAPTTTTTTTAPGPLLLFTGGRSGGSFIPYAVAPWSIIVNGVSHNISQVTANLVNTDEDTYLTYLQATFAGFGATGTVTRNLSTGVFTYTYGVGETGSLPSAVNVMTEYIKNIYDASVSGSTVRFTTRSVSSAVTNRIVSWGDGSGAVLYNNATTVPYDTSHAYTSGTSTTPVWIFRETGTVNEYSFDGSTYTAKLLSQTGTMPSINLYFSITNNLYLIDPFALISLSTAAANIESFLLRGNNTAAFTGSIFTVPMPNLSEVILQQNNLSTAEIDQHINDFVNNSWTGMGGGTLTAWGNVGAASAASLTSRNTLISAGWTVTV